MARRWATLLEAFKEKNAAAELKHTSLHPPASNKRPAVPADSHNKTKVLKPFVKPKKITTRRYQPKRIAVKPTADRPAEVTGEERFTKWRPPPELRSQSRTEYDDEKVRQVITSSFAKKTKDGYGTAVAHWNNFCDRRNVPENKRSPADPDLVEIWISEAAGQKSGGYLSDWVAGLHAWHTLNDLPWLVDVERMRLIKRGARYEQPTPKDQREPMTLDWLSKVLPKANLNDHRELAVAAAATCGVWGLFRLGELIVNDEGFDPARNVTRKDLVPQMVGPPGQQTLTITVKLPRTKTQHHGESVVLAQQSPPSDPVSRP